MQHPNTVLSCAQPCTHIFCFVYKWGASTPRHPHKMGTLSPLWLSWEGRASPLPQTPLLKLSKWITSLEIGCRCLHWEVWEENGHIQTNKQTNNQTSKQTNEWTNKQTNEWTHKQRTNEWRNKPTNQPTNQPTNKQTNERTNKQTLQLWAEQSWVSL